MSNDGTKQFSPPTKGISRRARLTPQILLDSSWVNADPGPASDWLWSPDNRQATFHLANGVTFHDGSPFTAKVARA